MVRAFILGTSKKLDSLSLTKNLTMPKLGSEEILVHHKAVGVNSFDMETIRGDHGATKPFVPGIEVIGVVEAVGLAARMRFTPGMRVAYCSLGTGGYGEKSIVHMRHLVIVPEYISDEKAAAGLLKGVMAIMLLLRVYSAKIDSNLLIFNVLGGIGHLVAQLAKHGRCNVIGVVSDERHFQSAFANGCSQVLTYDDLNFANKIAEYTDGLGVDIVYDSIYSKNTLKLAEYSLGLFGMYVAFGQISGEHPKISLRNAQQKSLYITRPSMFHYYSLGINMQLAAAAAFDLLHEGIIKPVIKRKYSFEEIPKAHSDMVERRNKMSNVILF